MVVTIFSWVDTNHFRLKSLRSNPHIFVKYFLDDGWTGIPYMYVFTVYLFAFFSREVVVTYHVSQLLSHLHTYSQCFNFRIYISHDKEEFAKGSSLYYTSFSRVSIYKNCLTAQCCTFLFTFSLISKKSKLTKPSLAWALFFWIIEKNLYFLF